MADECKERGIPEHHYYTVTAETIRRSKEYKRIPDKVKRKIKPLLACEKKMLRRDPKPFCKSVTYRLRQNGMID